MIEDELQAAVDAEIDAIRPHIARIVQLRYQEEYPDDPPYVQGFIVAAEWTNVDLERTNQGGISVASPRGQALSMSRGLGMYAVDNYGQD